MIIKLLLAYVTVNILVFAVYGIDKFKAHKGFWRTPEKTLLTISAFGPFGAILGMKFFRHKTRKPKFTVSAPVLCALHVIIIIVITYKFLMQ